MNKNTNKRLPIHLLMSLANAVCNYYGFERVISMEVQKLYRSKISPCILRNNGKGMLWIDPEYIALQIGEGEVVYLYMTMAHINEEISSYKQASRARGEKVELPADILTQFSKAAKLMKYTVRSFYLTPAAADYGPDWVDKWQERFYADAAEISKRHEAELIRKKEVVA